MQQDNKNATILELSHFSLPEALPFAIKQRLVVWAGEQTNIDCYLLLDCFCFIFFRSVRIALSGINSSNKNHVIL